MFRLPAFSIAIAFVLILTVSARAQNLQSEQMGTIDTIAGGGLGDGGSALDAGIQPIGAVGHDARGVLYAGDRSFDQCRTRRVAAGRISTITDACAAAISPDGSVYLYGDGCTIDRWRDGLRVRVAGNGTCGQGSGDGGPAVAASFSSVGSVAVAVDGSLYIASYSRIRRITNGIITTIAGNGICCGEDGDGGPATAAKIESGPIALDRKGSLYLASAAFGRCAIRRITNGIIEHFAGTGEYDDQGRACKFAGDDGPLASAGIDPQALAFDSEDNLYIAGNCRIRKVEGGIITTIAGTGERRPPVDNSGAPCQGGEDGAALSTNVALNRYSAGISVDASGDVVIGEWCRVRVLHAGVVRTVAGNSNCFFLGDGGPARDAGIFITGVATAPNGDIFIADGGTCRVRRIRRGVITTIAGTGKHNAQFYCDYGGVPGKATDAAIGSPLALAVARNGDVYVAVEVFPEWFRHQPLDCHVLRIHGGKAESIAGTDGRCGFGGDDGPASGATLNTVRGVALGPDGSLYLADLANCRVRKIKDGIITTIAGNGAGSPPHFCPFEPDGAGTATSLLFPAGVAVGASGEVYIAELGACRVRKLENGMLTTVAGAGTTTPECAYDDADGPALQAKLAAPWGLALGTGGELLIADYGDWRIRELQGGAITTVAGTGPPFIHEGSDADGIPAVQAELYGPYGITFNAGGDLLVADGYRLRVVYGAAPPDCPSHGRSDRPHACPPGQVPDSNRNARGTPAEDIGAAFRTAVTDGRPAQTAMPYPAPWAQNAAQLGEDVEQ